METGDIEKNEIVRKRFKERNKISNVGRKREQDH